MNENNNNYDSYNYATYNYGNYNDPTSIQLSQYKSLLGVGIGWLGLSVVATIVSFIVGAIVGDITLLEDIEIIKINGYINVISYGIILISLLAVLGLPIIKQILKQFTDINKLGKGIMYGGILLGTSILYNMIVLLFYPDFGSNQNQNSVLTMITNMPVLSFLCVVLFAPITEEITYRLCLTGMLRKKSKIFAITVSSLLFGLIHSAFLNLNFIGMTEQELIDELIALPSYIISGVVMALAYTNEDSIATSIIAHMTNNFIAFIQAFIPVEELFRAL